MAQKTVHLDDLPTRHIQGLDRYCSRCIMCSQMVPDDKRKYQHFTGHVRFQNF